MSGWHVGVYGDVFDGDGRLIASVHGEGLTRKRNSRILAAGEEMLEALEGVVEWFGPLEDWATTDGSLDAEMTSLEKAVVAIARARDS